MENDVNGDIAEFERGHTPPWLRPTSYWLPVHFPVSAWHTHAAFAAWLVDVLRPHRIVELGTHFGFSCFVFAEAAKRLGLDASISALDTWEGDDHAGHYDEEVFQYVQRVAHTDYPESVNLMRGWFSQSRPLIADSSVDLLHIDGRHSYEDVAADYEEWRSAVRDGGVILFHDIAERANDFGVWRLWDEIAEPGRSFAFEHGHGLGVLAVGPIEGGPLRSLFSADESTADLIRDDFRRLGDRVVHQARLESLPEELERVWAEVRLRAVHEDVLEQALNRQNEYIEALKQTTSWKVTRPLRAIGKLRHRRD